MEGHDEACPVIEAVAFDLDGLMFNTELIYTQVAEQMLRQRGLELDLTLIDQMMGLPARVGLPMMIEWYNLRETATQLEEETQRIFRQILPDTLAPMPGLLRLLAFLDEQQIPKAIVTSSGRDYLEYILRLAALPTDFDFELTAEDIVQGKPHPDVYLKAAATFRIEPTHMLVLEDSEHGCRAGVAANAITVAVPGGHNRTRRYPGAHLLAESLEDPRLWSLLGAFT